MAFFSFKLKYKSFGYLLTGIIALASLGIIVNLGSAIKVYAQVTNGTVPVVVNDAGSFGQAIVYIISQTANLGTSVIALILSVLARVGHFQNKEKIQNALGMASDAITGFVSHSSQIKELAEVSYDAMGEKANQIVNKPTIKLVNLAAQEQSAINAANKYNAVVQEFK